MTRFTLWMLLAMVPVMGIALAPASLMAADEAVAGEVEGAEASEDHEHAAHPASPLLNVDVGSAIWNLLIFGTVFFILATFVWPPILKGLQAREDKIRTDLEGAEDARKEAIALRGDLQKQLDDAQSKVQAMLSDAQKDADVKGQRIVAQAKEAAERQLNRSIAEIQTAKQVALSEMAGQTADIAMTLAKQVVGRELKADDHADLIRQSLDRLPSNN